MFLGAAPTNRPVTINGLSLSRFKDGKIIETWGLWDTGDLFRQLGVSPPAN